MESHEVGQGRKHDYALQCYLEGFALNSNNKSQLYVVDSVTERAFVTTPQKVAAGRNFNLMRAGEEKSDPIESGQADFESKLAPALVRMNDKGDFSDDADRAVILRLIALLAVLNPSRTEQTIRRLVDVALAHPQAWESQRKKAAAAGVEGAGDLTFEDLRHFSKRGDYTLAPPTTEYVEQQLLSVSTVYNLLLQRSWRVARAAPDSGGFITSDNPVTLTWDDQEMEGGYYPPGFGLQGTSVVFPLSKELAMRGRFDGRVDTLELPVDAVAGINSRTIFYAGQQLYAESDRFRFIDRHLLMCYGQDLLPTLLRS